MDYEEVPYQIKWPTAGDHKGIDNIRHRKGDPYVTHTKRKLLEIEI